MHGKITPERSWGHNWETEIQKEAIIVSWQQNKGGFTWIQKWEQEQAFLAED